MDATDDPQAVSVKTEPEDAPSGGYHPSYPPSPDTDITLCSNEGMLFAVSSHLLKLTCGFFNTMFSLPRDAAGTDANEPIPMSEDSHVIAGLLDLAFRMDVPPLHSIDLLESILRAAEKYDVTPAMVMIRNSLTSPLLEASPTRIYGIACERGWDKEASWASSKTISLDLCSADALSDLSRMNGVAVTKLLELHRRRRDLLRSQLDDPDIFEEGNRDRPECSTCDEAVDNNPWQLFKYCLVSRMEREPISLDDLDGREMEDIVEATCPRCKKRLYNPVRTKRRLREIIKGLPDRVEFP